MRRPEELRLPLPTDDDWIVVKKHLTAGEERQIYARMVTDVRAGEVPRLDPMQVGLSQMVGYLLDWSITDVDGNPVRVRGRAPEEVAAILNDIDGDKFREIAEAVAAHETAMREQRAEEKKSRGGATPLSETSASVG